LKLSVLPQNSNLCSFFSNLFHNIEILFLLTHYFFVIMDSRVAKMIHISQYQTIPFSGYWLNGKCNRDFQRFPSREASSTITDKNCLKSSITCKYWINDNCIYGDQCRNLHSWSISKETSINMQNIVKVHYLSHYICICNLFNSLNH